MPTLTWDLKIHFPLVLLSAFFGDILIHNKKGWKVYDLDRGRHFISRDVQFMEDIFPFSSSLALTDPESVTQLTIFPLDDTEESPPSEDRGSLIPPAPPAAEDAAPAARGSDDL